MRREGTILKTWFLRMMFRRLSLKAWLLDFPFAILEGTGWQCWYVHWMINGRQKVFCRGIRASYIKVLQVSTPLSLPIHTDSRRNNRTELSVGEKQSPLVNECTSIAGLPLDMLPDNVFETRKCDTSVWEDDGMRRDRRGFVSLE